MIAEQQELLLKFSNYLVSVGISPSSLKFYRSDLNHFLNHIQNFSEINTESVENYLSRNSTSSSIKTTNRRLSTLRKFSQFLADTGLNSSDFMSEFKNVTQDTFQAHFIQSKIEPFDQFLIDQKISKNTRRNYLSDLNRFLVWKKKTNGNVKEYLNHLYLNVNRASHDRTVAALKKYYEYKKEEFPLTKLNIPKNAVYSPIQQKILSKLSSHTTLQSLLHSIFYSRPKWYKIYHSYPLSSYIHFAILVVFSVLSGYLIYDRLFVKAYPTNLTVPNRYLSFQGKLTNSAGLPITTATNHIFKLYNVDSGGQALWDSGDCSITPDQDGKFSTLLGGDCGAEISSSVFFENAGVWLGVSVGGDAEASPRIQVATVDYALNSKTLQGLPLGTEASTVPYIDSTGKLTIAAASPTILSTSGTFAVTGQAMTISTEDYTDGSISINPDGTGTLNLIFEGTSPGGDANGFVNAENANITTGALYAGTVTNTATGYRFIDFKSGITPTSKFYVDYAGNTTMSGDLTLSGGNINTGNISFVIGDSTTDSIQLQTDGTGNGEIVLPNDSIGPNEVASSGQTDEYCLTYESTGGTWEWQTCGSAGSSVWSALTDPGANLALNMTTYTTTFNWDTGTGASDLFSLTTDDSSNGTGSLLNLQTGTSSTVSPLRVRAGTVEGLSVSTAGNVGIGTTGPDAKLDSLATSGEQLRLTYTDSSVYTGFIVDSTGDLTIDATGGDLILADDLTVSGGNINTGNIAFVLGDATTDSITLTTDGTGNAEVVLPNDSVGPNEVFTTGQTDEYCLTYEATGTTWEWQTCGSGGSSVWSSLTSPVADLTLTMAAYNTTFNWDPGADSAETNFSLTTQGEDTTGTGDQDQILLSLSQTSNGVDVDQAADALLIFANNDLDDPVVNAIRFDAGAAGTDFTYGINFDAASFGTAEIILSNAETISNLVDGTLALGTTTLSLTGGTSIVSDQSTVSLFNATTTTLNLGLAGSGTSSIILSGGSSDTGCTLDGSNGNLTCSGTLTATAGIFTQNLQVNNASAVAYNRFGSATTGHTGNISNGDDLLISGDLELDGTFFLDGGTLANSAGTASLILSATPTTTANTLSASNWYVDNTANVGQAALIINQQKAGDLLTASVSGSPKMSINPTGDLTLGYNGTSIPTTTNPLMIYGHNTTNVASIDTAGLLTLASDLAVNGDDITADGALTINSASYVRVGDTATPGSANGDDDLYVEGDLEVDGTTYLEGSINLGDGTGDTVTANTGAWTFSNDTNFVLSGGINGLSFDTDTLSIDATNDRVGIGTTAPSTKLDVVIDDAVNNSITNVVTLSHTTSGTATAASSNFSPDQANSLGNNLVAYYKMDEISGTRTDSAGSNDLTAFGTGGVTDSPAGKKSSAADFERDDSDYLRANPSTMLSPSSNGFTIAGWFQLESEPAGFMGLASRFNGSTAYNTQWELWWDNVSQKFKFTVYRQSNGALLATTTADTLGATATSTWYFVVAWYDPVANTISIQVNNGSADSIAINTTNLGEIADQANSYMIVGADTGGTAGFFDGLIDEVGIWQRVLTTQEKSDLYNSDSANTCTDDCNSPTTTTTGIGTGVLLRSEDASGNAEDQARISSLFNTATNGSETSSLLFETRSGGSALARTMRLDGAGNLTTQGAIYGGGSPDIAENIIVTDLSIEAGDVVEIDHNYLPADDNIYNRAAAKKAEGLNSQSLLGVISSDPGIIINTPENSIENSKISAEDERPLALAGRVPVKVTNKNGNISIGDPLTSSDISGYAAKSTAAGKIIGTALENFSCPVEAVCSGKILTYINISWYDPDIYFDQAGELIVQNQTLAEESETSNTIYKVIKTAIDGTQTVINKIGSFNSLVSGSINSGKVSTNLISPISNSDLIVDLEPENAPSSSRLVVKGIEDKEVAVIEADGSASFAGQLTSDSLEVTNDATVSGTLYADKIESSKLDEIEKLLREVEENKTLIAEASAWNEKTDTEIIQSENFKNIYITETAAISKLFVQDTITANSLNSLEGTLFIQPLALQPVEIMAGRITIDTAGNTKFLSNVEVTGDLTIKNLIISNENSVSSPSAQIVSGEINTNAVAGKAKLASGTTEIKIINSHVKNTTLVYITPTTSTENKVLYVKSKDDGFFVVGFNESIGIDVEFNWWIIELQAEPTQSQPDQEGNI